MPTGPELTEERRWLATQGFTVELIVRQQERATWYRADGLALPNLPADAYHRERFRRKGWTLVAPDVQPTEETEMPVLELPELPEPPRPLEGAPLAASHQHKFPREMGSKCKHPSCDQIRQIAYRPIKRRKSPKTLLEVFSE
jgi:hypothetical protein